MLRCPPVKELCYATDLNLLYETMVWASIGAYDNGALVPEGSTTLSMGD